MTIGPVVACQNAIDHYTNEIEKVHAELQKLTRQVNEKRSTIATLSVMRDQWVNAKETLEKSQTKD